MKKFIYIIATVTLLLPALFSCNGWLDVEPSTQVKAETMFSTEEGFKSALDGIYVSLTDERMYGREMSFGFVDHIAWIYDVQGTRYREVVLYDYENMTVMPMINNMWLRAYNVIVNINMMLGYIDGKKDVFREKEYYDIIKAEALAIRAYVHFDLLRLFGQSPVTGMNSKSIPYITEFKKQVTPQGTVAEVIEKALEDLTAAAALLRGTDPMVTGRQVTLNDDNGYLTNRSFRMNYYAVKALIARIALYKGDQALASSAAKEVIESGRFSWVDPATFTRAEAEQDRIFARELIFGLYISDMTNRVSRWFNWTNGESWNIPSMTSATRGATYENDSYDFRSARLFSVGLANQAATTKYLQPYGMPDSLSSRLPMIRLSEMYYIAAETNLPDATRYLDSVRIHRGMSGALPTSLTNEERQSEIHKEHLKEFHAEGQVFYYYKRKNMVPPRAPTPQDVRMVIPLPDAEIDFGKREVL